MRTTTKLWILTGVLLMARTSFAQEKPNPNDFYRLDFVTRELDDNKLINTRTFSATTSGTGGAVKAGSRVPIPAGNGQVTFIDVGVSIDCRDLREVSGQLTMAITTDISSAAVETGSASTGAPVIRQYKWTASIIVPLRKATQIFSSDDLGSKRKFQLELTATPIK